MAIINLKSHFPPDFVASEVSRYLGIPGQAISYKVGEREWLAAREESKTAPGASVQPQRVAHPRAVPGTDGSGADAGGVQTGVKGKAALNQRVSLPTCLN